MIDPADGLTLDEANTLAIKLRAAFKPHPVLIYQQDAFSPFAVIVPFMLLSFRTYREYLHYMQATCEIA